MEYRQHSVLLFLRRSGVNGPVVAFLFGFTTLGISVNKGVVVGTITKNDLVGPLAGRSLVALVKSMKAGDTYVNAHTEKNPNGEIRGQIQRIPMLIIKEKIRDSNTPTVGR